MPRTAEVPLTVAVVAGKRLAVFVLPVFLAKCLVAFLRVADLSASTFAFALSFGLPKTVKGEVLVG